MQEMAKVSPEANDPLDDNRAKVVERNSMPVIIALLEDNELLVFGIPVLYNICVDYGMSTRGKIQRMLLTSF